MRIEKVNLIQKKQVAATIFKIEQESCAEQYQKLPIMQNNIAFRGDLIKYVGAKNYLKNEASGMLKGGLLRDPFDLFSLDLKKLDGIQEGIKVFKDMTMKEIAFILTTVSEFATIRGCHNICVHCYGDAKPPLKENDTFTGKMLWEDFVALTSGIKELNQRLGFYASGLFMNNNERYLTTFHDSDCIETVIKDKLGIEHDFIELAEILHDTMGIRVMFDTAGWNITNKSAQKRAEKLVEHYKTPENREVLDQINISFSPFHSINNKSVELKRQNKLELAEKLRDIYTTRMANVLYTFTPLHKSYKFNILSTCAPNEEGFDGYKSKDVEELFSETLGKLRDLYVQDLEGEREFVKSKKEILSKVSNLKKHFKGPRIISFSEKAKRNLGSFNKRAEETDRYVYDTKEYLNKLDKKSIDTYRDEFVGMIDSNGNYYLTNYYFTIPTGLRLNFKNDKVTAPVRPNLLNELFISKNVINNF